MNNAFLRFIVLIICTSSDWDSQMAEKSYQRFLSPNQSGTAVSDFEFANFAKSSMDIS